MEISLNLILEALSPYTIQNHIKEGRTICFSRICLLPELPEEVAPARLYVGTLQAALSLKEAGAEFYAVCVPAGKKKTAGEEDQTEGLILIEEKESPGRIFAQLQDLFCRINEWSAAMLRCAYERRPLQDILDLSEPVIGNFISVSDSALSLVCCTRHIKTDDPLSRKLVANGYHTEDTIRIFRKEKLFELWDNAEGFIINKKHTFSPYDLCSKVFKLHNTYYIHAVMVCQQKPLSPALLDLFRMLTDVLALYVKQDWQQHSFTRHDYDRFLIELIEERAGAPAIIENRAAHLGIALAGRYQLCLVDFKSLDKLPVARLGIALSGVFPEARSTIYQNRILLLFYGTGEEEDMLFPEGKLEEWLSEYDAACAVSGIFESIMEIRIAYEQTRLLLQRFGQLADPLQTGEKKMPRIAFFDSHFLPLLLAENPMSRIMWRTTRCFRMLKRIKEYDEKHGTNNIQLLYTYLFCDCRATEASAILHMHRNNVLYRISRIEEMTGAKLSDQKVRYELFCGCSLLQLYGV